MCSRHFCNFINRHRVRCRCHGRPGRIRCAPAWGTGKVAVDMAAKMDDLTKQPPALSLYRFSYFPELRNAGAVISINPLLAPEAGPVHPDRLENDQARPTGCPRPVIIQMPLTWQVIFAKVRRMCGNHDPVPHLNITNAERLKDMRIADPGHRNIPCNATNMFYIYNI